MDDYSINDSGERRTFEGGAQRDRGTLKPRPDLIHPYFLMRLGMHLARGAIKYDAWNWAKGMPVSEFMASASRHMTQFMCGENSEDHLAAIAFNVMGAMVVQAGVHAGVYPEHFDDLPDLSGFVDLMKNIHQKIERKRGDKDGGE